MGIGNLEKFPKPVEEARRECRRPFTIPRLSMLTQDRTRYLLLVPTWQMRPWSIPANLRPATDQEQAEPKRGNHEGWDKREHEGRE